MKSYCAAELARLDELEREQVDRIAELEREIDQARARIRVAADNINAIRGGKQAYEDVMRQVDELEAAAELQARAAAADAENERARRIAELLGDLSPADVDTAIALLCERRRRDREHAAHLDILREC